MTNHGRQSTPGSGSLSKDSVIPMSDERKVEVVAQLADQVIAKLTAAFFEVVTNEKWGKRDLAKISGLNETQIGHILAGRRKNLTTETIALLARAMRKRPELVLQDMRPKGNRGPVPPQLTTTQNKLTFGKKEPIVTTTTGSV